MLDIGRDVVTETVVSVVIRHGEEFDKGEVKRATSNQYGVKGELPFVDRLETLSGDKGRLKEDVVGRVDVHGHGPRTIRPAAWSIHRDRHRTPVNPFDVPAVKIRVGVDGNALIASILETCLTLGTRGNCDLQRPFDGGRQGVISARIQVDGPDRRPCRESVIAGP